MATSCEESRVVPPRATGGRPSQCTLGACLDILGPVVLRPLLTPRGTDVPVGEVVIAGPGDPLPPSESAVLLLIGVPGDSASALRIVERAGALGYAAVIVRHLDRSAVDTVAEEAARGGVALLETPEGTSWRHLNDLLAAAVAIGSVSDDDVGAGAADLFSLANSIASRVGGAVTIEDPHGHVLAYSSLPDHAIDGRRRDSILGRHTPDRPENADEFRRVIQARGKAVRFDFPDPGSEASRLAVAVFAGAEPVGLIFALDHDPPLGDDAPARLEEAARLTALHLLRSRAQQHPQRWAQAEALRLFLDGVGSPAAVADRLGEATKGACVVLAVAAGRDATDDPVDLSTTRVPDVVGVQCRGWTSSSVTTLIGERVYALLPVSAGTVDGDPRLRQFATNLASTVNRSTGLAICVAIGPVAPTVDDVLLSRRVADRVVTVAESQRMDTDQFVVTSLADVRAEIVLNEIAERERHMLLYYGGPADVLLEHDREHGTEYAATLLAHLEAFGKTDVAARRLMVHENTLRYRIRRLAEIFDMTFDDPDDRLLAWLQLRVHLGDRRS
jgi:hypothetical protein